MERKRVQESKNRHLYPATAQAKETARRASRKDNEARRQERQRVCKQKPAMPPWDRRDIAGSEQDYAYAKREMQSAIRICPM